MKRSFSVPVKLKNPSLKRLGSTGGVIRVVSMTQQTVEVDNSLTTDGTVSDNDNEEGGEDIPEEEAVCRICLVELNEGGDAFKLECSCKGELALAHKECAVKWFTIKGNKICDVCQRDVKNLPVTLLRLQSHSVLRRPSTIQEQTEATSYRVWQDIPILVIVSMLAYFCFLEQLLDSKNAMVVQTARAVGTSKVHDRRDTWHSGWWIAKAPCLEGSWFSHSCFHLPLSIYYLSMNIFFS